MPREIMVAKSLSHIFGRISHTGIFFLVKLPLSYAGAVNLVGQPIMPTSGSRANSHGPSTSKSERTS